MVKIGDYPPDDSDWNYKDVTHAEKVHDSIDSRINTAVSSDFQLGIDTLVLFGFKFPVSLVQYEYAKYNIFYYTTFGPFVILTKTIIESHENNKSKTTSNFSIGSIVLLLRCLINIFLLGNSLESFLNQERYL